MSNYPPTGPGAEFTAETTGPREMRYLYSYSVVFEHPEWMMNVLLLAVCGFIPVVGPIVQMGYGYSLIEHLHRFPRHPYPKFDFERFVDYLKQGLWPFLFLLLASVIMVPVMMGVVMIPIALLAAMAGPGNGPPAVIFLIVIPIVFLLANAVMVLFMMLAEPLTLRGGLSQEFGEQFNFGFAKDYISRVWLEVVLVFLFLMFTSPILVFLGLLLCFIGVYPAAAVLQIASFQLRWQLYELYLSRGGQPIPLPNIAPPAPAAAPPSGPMPPPMQ